MRVALLAAMISLTSAVDVKSQAALIPRPDTLGANFDAARPGKGTPQDYDFLVGTWTYRYQLRDPQTGNYAPVLTGTWTGSKPHDELMFEDEFAPSAPNGTRGIVMTYRVFKAAEGVWSIQGIGVRRGVWQPGTSWSDGRDRFLVQDNPETKIRLRIRYYAIERDHFLWRADGSRDGGLTWMRDVILIEATRKKGS